ncbi:MAG: ABC transporter substrate-binding protein [Candidatus Thiodiazotropha sp.]
MDRRWFLKRLILITASVKLPLLGGCSAPTEPLVLAIHPWVGYETLYLAREFKWLPDKVVLAEGKTLSDSFAALQSGRADGACMTLDEMLRARASGIPLSVALVFDVSTGADMVLGRADIDTPADLAGNHGYLLGPDSRLVSAARSLSTMMVRYGLLPREDNLVGLIMPDTLPSGDY